MNIKTTLKNLGKSIFRICLALAIIALILFIFYRLWTPGLLTTNGKYDKGQNAIWIGHGWLGDDTWFKRNPDRNISDFHDPDKIKTLFNQLKENHISTVYPHLCPTSDSGDIAPYDDKQMEIFLNLAEEYQILVIPWIGGILGESALIEDDKWRENFIASIVELFQKHPRIGGVQLNIEPLPSGNTDFLKLLDELKPAMENRILCIAAYPPPTRLHPFPNVHWEIDYIKDVGKRSNQMAVMMYDTSIRLEKLYINLMRQWTQQLLDTVAGTDCQLLFGLPAYEDADSGYHNPRVENLKSALSGVQHGLSKAENKNYLGCAIYCEWEMTPEKWQIWRKYFLMH